jgi:hypothetical protein
MKAGTTERPAAQEAGTDRVSRKAAKEERGEPAAGKAHRRDRKK